MCGKGKQKKQYGSACQVFRNKKIRGVHLKDGLGDIPDVIGFSHGVIMEYRYPRGLEFLGLGNGPFHTHLSYFLIGSTGINGVYQRLWQIYTEYLWQ